MADLADDDIAGAPHLRRPIVQSSLQEFGRDTDRRQGIAQFMGQHRQEFVLGAAQALSLGARSAFILEQRLALFDRLCDFSYRRALSIAVAACAAMPSTMRSVRSVNLPASEWPKNRPPSTSPDRETTDTAR